MIGLCLQFKSTNYGTTLQAYATKHVIENMGYDTELVEYIKQKDTKYYIKQLTRLSSPLFRSVIKRRSKNKLISILNRNFAKNENIRFRTAKKYERKHLSDYITCYGFKELQEQANKYDTLLVGSDQLWLPVGYSTKFFTLMFAPDNVKKISYSTSFGVSEIPQKNINEAREFLTRFDYISVREKSGQKIVKSIADRDATLVCDPTMLLSREQWYELIPQERRYEEPYIFCYFLGKNKDHREAVKLLQEKTGYKIVVLKHLDEYISFDDDFGDYAPFDVDAAGFVNLIRNAEFVCTDSFHGTVFSIINQKKFLSFYRFNSSSKTSRNSRIDSLLSVLNLENRIYNGNIFDVQKTIDYENIKPYLDSFINESYSFLKKALSSSKKRERINVETVSDCTGCTACASVCPQNAISMLADEAGFFSPSIDRNLCTNCSLCEKTCPTLNHTINCDSIPQCFAVQNKNENDKLASSAGGFSSALSEHIFKQKGNIYAAVFDDKCHVIHKKIQSMDEFRKLRAAGSKYVASNINGTFAEIINDLKSGIKVAFFGLPCQVAGLNSIVNNLNIDRDKLVLVDLTCYGAPSPELYERYISACENEFRSKISSINFRDKQYGYSSPSLSITFKNGKRKCQNTFVKSYLRTYFKGLSAREVCYKCNFRAINRVSDFTIGDCRNIGKYYPELDDDKGTTVVYTHSQNAVKILNDMKDNIIIRTLPINEILASSGKKMMNDAPRHPNSASFKKALSYNITYKELIKRYAKPSKKEKCATIVKPIIHKTKLQKIGILKRLKGF